MGKLSTGDRVKSFAVPLLLHMTIVGGIVMGELMKKHAKRKKVGSVREMVKVWDEKMFRPRGLRIWIERGEGPGGNGVHGFGSEAGMQQGQGQGRGLAPQQYGPPADDYESDSSSSSDSGSSEDRHHYSDSHSQPHHTPSITTTSVYRPPSPGPNYVRGHGPSTPLDAHGGAGMTGVLTGYGEHGNNGQTTPKVAKKASKREDKREDSGEKKDEKRERKDKRKAQRKSRRIEKRVSGLSFFLPLLLRLQSGLCLWSQGLWRAC